jgi:hypothetical protein
MSKKNFTQAERQLQTRIIERFADGECHTLEEIVRTRSPGEVIHALLVPGGGAGPATARSFRRGFRVRVFDSGCPVFLAGFAQGVVGGRPRG